MEALRVRVKSVEVRPAQRLAVARVSATSTRKVRGRPVARIELAVAVEVERGEPAAHLRARLRDEALAFLDVE
jgi:hypothetical protein